MITIRPGSQAASLVASIMADRSDKNNGWIDWAVSARSDDPAQLASALEEWGLSLEDWVGV